MQREYNKSDKKTEKSEGEEICIQKIYTGKIQEI